MYTGVILKNQIVPSRSKNAHKLTAGRVYDRLRCEAG